MDKKSERDTTRKLKILTYALEHKNVAKTCRHFGIGPRNILSLENGLSCKR